MHRFNSFGETFASFFISKSFYRLGGNFKCSFSRLKKNTSLFPRDILDRAHVRRRSVHYHHQAEGNHVLCASKRIKRSKNPYCDCYGTFFKFLYHERLDIFFSEFSILDSHCVSCSCFERNRTGSRDFFCVFKRASSSMYQLMWILQPYS